MLRFFAMGSTAVVLSKHLFNPFATVNMFPTVVVPKADGTVEGCMHLCTFLRLLLS